MKANIEKSLSTQTSGEIHQQFSIPFDYKVIFTKGLFNSENPVLLNSVIKDGNTEARKMIFVIDSEVARCHPNLKEQIAGYCSSHSKALKLCGEPLVISGGESAKNNFQLVNDILQLVDDEKIDRHAYLLAIGGGAVLDLVGFVAAIAHRGIRHIRIPTTVLSQNDSGVGVKNGINFFNKKNYLGTFAPPFAVINDTDFLLTLDERDWRAGISEAVKVALIRDPAFYFWIEENAAKLSQRDLPTMEILIYHCAKHHMAHIATNGDPFEKGSSRPLDFGHWAAHKLEQLTDYDVRHGEAVAIGIALDVAYSFHIGLLDQESMEKIHRCLKALGFSISHPDLFDKNQTGFNPILWEGLEEFREHLGGKLTIMLLDEIGNGVETHQMDQSTLDVAVKELM